MWIVESLVLLCVAGSFASVRRDEGVVLVAPVLAPPTGEKATTARAKDFPLLMLLSTNARAGQTVREEEQVNAAAEARPIYVKVSELDLMSQAE